MNARTPFPPNAKPIPGRRPRTPRADQEFLPAALEILETPPSPVGIWLLWIICLFAVVTLSWAYFGRLDVVAVAQGKIQPTGRVKVIQPAEPGRISALLVENGQRVAKGESLVRFDSGDADADVAEFSANYDAFRAEVLRRQTALAVAASHDIGRVPTIVWSDGIPATIRSRETHVLEGDLGQLASAVTNLRAQQRQKQLERDRFMSTSKALEALIGTLQQRVDMRQVLETKGSGSKSDLIDALETLQDQKATLATARGQQAESAAAIEILGQSIEDSFRTFAAQNLQKLAEAERQVDDIEQKLAKARLRQSRMLLSSPINGTVSALSITTIGQVVASGDEIMRIVPDEIGIEVECYVPNRDNRFRQKRPARRRKNRIAALHALRDRRGRIDPTGE